MNNVYFTHAYIFAPKSFHACITVTVYTGRGGGGGGGLISVFNEVNRQTIINNLFNNDYLEMPAGIEVYTKEHS